MKQKSHIRPIVYVMISVFLIIGYAYLTSSLTINGASLLKKTTWDVHFENVQVKDGSVTGEQVTQEPEIDSLQTTVTFHVNLKKPGDYYEFTVDAVNAGTIDAMINSYTEFDLTEDQLKYLETSVTYEDGEEIAEKQQLLAGDYAVYKIVVSFKKDLEADDLPSSPEQLDLEFTVEYVQKDDTAIGRRAENSLYRVLKNETENGTLAKKYTYAHQDSMNSSLSTKDIYYWYANSSTVGQQVLNKNNVIFANHCWQMFRTTDTGGVKLIYNGEAENNQCLTTRGNHPGFSYTSFDNLQSTYYYGTDYVYDSGTGLFSLSGTVTTGSVQVGQYTCASTSQQCSTLYYVTSWDYGNYYNTLQINANSKYYQYGTLPFNNKTSSMAYVGYMYNNDEYKGISVNVSYESMLSDRGSLSTATNNYWFGTNAVWGNPVSNKYNLVDTYQISGSSDYQNLVGKYTFSNSSQTYTNSKVQYIFAVSSSQFFFVNLESGHDASYYNHTYTYGDSYVDNGNGTYSIVNPSTISRYDWYANYEGNISKDTYICKNAINNICSDLWQVTWPNDTAFYYVKVSNVYKFSNDFEYKIDESDGTYKYFLNDEGSSTFFNYEDSDNKNFIKNAHYTCFNASGICTKLSYVYFLNSLDYSYLELRNGKSIEDALNDMLYVDDVNNKSSTIKIALEAWYKKFMLNYSDYIEDTVFCYDRITYNYISNGFNPNGGGLSNEITFGDSPGLTCQNETDRYSINNSKAQIMYPVGLMNKKEFYLPGYDGTVKATGSYYWLGSPSSYYDKNNAYGYLSGTTGGLTSIYVSTSAGVRPVISLVPNSFYTSGDGSRENPYIIYTN